MKSNELRIGNLVNDYFREIIVDVNINVLKSILTNKRCLYKPILLTEEWLLKLGFHKYKGDNIDFFLNDFETSCNMDLLFWKGTQIKNINYVHQLQNLYFSLTGEELIFTKDK
jgi:hypothetical protein